MRLGIWINTKAATLPKRVTVLVWSLEGRWPPVSWDRTRELRADLLTLQKWPAGPGTPPSPLHFLSPCLLPSCSPPRTYLTSSTADPSDIGGCPLKWQTASKRLLPSLSQI